MGTAQLIERIIECLVRIEIDTCIKVASVRKECSTL